jgi:hypothetical protein
VPEVSANPVLLCFGKIRLNCEYVDQFAGELEGSIAIPRRPGLGE